MASFNLNDSTTTIPADRDGITQRIREGLIEATVRCSERCLYQSAKWAAELLDSLPDEDDEGPDPDAQMTGAEAAQSFNIFSPSYDDPEEAALEAKEGPKYLLAKSYFDTKEFDRCASVFLPPVVPAGGLAVYEKPKGRTPTSTPSKRNKQKQSDFTPLPRLSQKSLFLALYARYIAGEKRKEEGSEMVLGPVDGSQSVNRELPQLAKALAEYFRSRDAQDPQLRRSQGWLEYLYGIVLARSKQDELATDWLLRAVRLNPFHWAAWEELATLLTRPDDLHDQIASGLLPPNIMTLIYQVHASIDLFATTDPSETSTLQSLLDYFPSSTFLLTLQALALYHAKEFESSASIFQDILVAHPYRIDALDYYSNILHVMCDRPKLSFLAHLATSVDKFRPETCCVVGNYYSLCSQHEKAVLYFRRALTLDHNFLSAWMLMGHEYIELKNTHAAIEAYRRAVDVNRKEYRAWYGLGQAYEVLDMGFYALYYYQRAAGLRPYDATMWQAVGSCYQKMERYEQAIKALKRALAANTYFEPETPVQSFNASVAGGKGKAAAKKTTGRKLLDPETLFQIASLYERMGSDAETARYMELCVSQETGGSSKVSKDEHKPRRKATASAPSSQRPPTSSATAEEVEILNDGDTEIMSSSGSDRDKESENNADAEHDEQEDGFGTGTTATTSKARLWLARYAFKQGDLDTAERLAEELCMDGYEVEEAKGLVREVRGRREMASSVGEA